ncbi:TIGR01621 family pseudouridine synthase [Vibrio mangrovi]|uniref:Ribosomal large subunit pseudouridine synthase C n=1 Tax=Vibrio mangrovi TaxID=474394 RepID=A0A1Y6INZ0_9VIBR|nr:TIGR01621 family pseudouridine synthase [Vibrio mangrovi]MDW6003838.1 TIGR01621 family pseudouridine synthase [Vibrio mangrovi]SMR99367.1 Ribosomal large subunit pseudouridine synthase C [Vibrio mangrovi]
MFRILFVHSDFVLIHKYPGVSVHKDDGETMLVHEIRQALGSGPLYLVHRLDKMTSGLLLLARSAEAARILSTCFAERMVEKYYLAIGSKKPKKKQGLICGDMVRSRRSGWMLTTGQSNPAITQFFSTAGEDGERLFICRPLTGKTHQIRVALKSIGSAIVGDSIYNSSSEADRGYLHAYALKFPYAGEWHSFICDPRTDDVAGDKWQEPAIIRGIGLWSEPWSLNWPEVKLKR